ncbi:MAG: CDP-glucose 4,6-dehydratase [Gomphosphaeria aponina SAG 52.96 = DSM 107014]|uniref:CDP-glucose 4,6-dehydratase n=1 Tax=Gomphosphaeria aponina SAG 52.96 = DSM 107014 TaxID=1521640 RepID=A0A941GVX3_9CHRO|nr:CDP-glucose 4,6-dehydratase [Gomphosphaeria aponina SAG 52.96 = DSM 107014]
MQLELAKDINHHIGDLREDALVKSLVKQEKPDVVFHLAAQPLVRRSYREPVLTWQTNVIGTINVMEALRPLDYNCAAVLITTDKVYENKEWVHAYREIDPLGGYEPYSSSKGAAEIAIASWRKSFFTNSPVAIASVRSGNVIGGGDWSEDRIVPDAMRALQQNQSILVRNPKATRPWQHVLEPLGGYLLLAEKMYAAGENNSEKNPFTDAFNFGPNITSNRSVKDLVEEILKYWPGTWSDVSDPHAVHEANLLNLSIDKVYHQLNWQPKWDFSKTIATTVAWYRQVFEAKSSSAIRQITKEQINSYY